MSTEISLLGILLVSLLGSTHCAGMCGGFVVLYSGERSAPSLFVHSLYHLGRLATYLSLGCFAGFIGKSFDNAAGLVGVQQASLLLTGVILFAWGAKLFLTPSASSLTFANSFIGKLYKHSLGLIMSNTSASQHRRAFLLGLLTTLLPCGWLYVYVVLASGSGDPIRAMLIMFFFWLGTVPILAGLGIVNRYLSSRLRNFVPRASGLMMMFAGILSLLLHAGYDFGLHDHHQHNHQQHKHHQHTPNNPIVEQGAEVHHMH